MTRLSAAAQRDASERTGFARLAEACSYLVGAAAGAGACGAPSGPGAGAPGAAAGAGIAAALAAAISVTGTLSSQPQDLMRFWQTATTPRSVGSAGTCGNAVLNAAIAMPGLAYITPHAPATFSVDAL